MITGSPSFSSPVKSRRPNRSLRYFTIDGESQLGVPRQIGDLFQVVLTPYARADFYLKAFKNLSLASKVSSSAVDSECRVREQIRGKDWMVFWSIFSLSVDSHAHITRPSSVRTPGAKKWLAAGARRAVCEIGP